MYLTYLLHSNDVILSPVFYGHIFEILFWMNTYLWLCISSLSYYPNSVSCIDFYYFCLKFNFIENVMLKGVKKGILETLELGVIIVKIHNSLGPNISREWCYNTLMVWQNGIDYPFVFIKHSTNFTSLYQNMKIDYCIFTLNHSFIIFLFLPFSSPYLSFFFFFLSSSSHANGLSVVTMSITSFFQQNPIIIH